MVNRILQSSSAGSASALVFVAVGDPLRLPGEGSSTPYYLAWAGLVCVLALHRSASGAKSAGCSAAGRRATARWRPRASLVVLGILVAINYIGTKQNKRWDLTANKQFSLSDQTRNVLAEARCAAAGAGVRAGTAISSVYQDRLKEYTYSSKQITTDTSIPTRSRRSPSRIRCSSTARIVFNYKGRSSA